MKELPAPLAGLAAYPKFICWKTETRDGKLIKLPCNHLGDVIDSQDPRYFMTAEQAIHYANATPGLGVGYVFTENDPFYFIDIDKCNDNGEWSPIAKQLCEQFAGAAIEVSQSGLGLHIIGRGVSPPHSKRNKEYGLEFYTEKRFIALTGTAIVGDCSTEATAHLAQFGPQYFPMRPEYDSAEWTTEPNEKSKPIKGDAALIKKAMESTSAGAAFGLRASFKQLYEADEGILGKIWPPEKSVDPFDRSYADMALCQHLSFWTGGDCERMERLFEKSALVRGKWEDREDYRRGTITYAVARTKDFYGSAEAAKIATRITDERASELPKPGKPLELLSGGRVIPFEGRQKFFAGHVLLENLAEVFCPDGNIRAQTAYNTIYGGREFAEQFGGKTIREPWDAYVRATDVNVAVAYDTCYRPEFDFGAIIPDDGLEYVNCYVPAPGESIEGDATPFINHAHKILPDGRDAEILLSWCAALIQYPGVKFLWSPLVQGVEGNGKSIFGDVLRYCIGRKHQHDVNPKGLCETGAKFNKWMQNHRLATIEELKTQSRVDAEGTLKRLIANQYIEMEGKGADQITIRNIINFYITSNFKDAVLITDTTRRIAPLFTAQQNKLDLLRAGMQSGGPYFKKFIHWLKHEDGWAICHNFLETYAIPDELNPATDCDKAPETTAINDAIAASKTGPHLAVIDALTTGIPGTRAGWVSVTAVNEYLKNDTDGRRASPRMIAKYLTNEGYIKHPVLTNQGRLTRPVMEEGNTRPTVFLRPNHPALMFTHASQVTNAYVEAQGYTNAGAVSVSVVPVASKTV